MRHLALQLFLLSMLPIAYAADQQLSSARVPSLPPALEDRLSPLSKQQELYYGKFIKRGGPEAMSDLILSEFCKSARLLCSASLQESTWGSPIDGATTPSLALESHMDRRSFPGWVKGKRSLPSTSKPGMDHTSLTFDKNVFGGWSPKADKSPSSASESGMGEVETTSLAFDKSVFGGWSPKAGGLETPSLAFDKSVFGGWSPKADKSLPSASEIGMVDVETTSLAFDKSVFGGWSPKADKSLPSASKAGMGGVEVETTSLTFDKSVFGGWSPKADKSLPSTSKAGMGRKETTSLAFDKSIFGGWSPKSDKSLPSTSEIGMGGLETASLAFDNSVFGGWSPKAEKSPPSASRTGVGKTEPAHLFVQRWASRMGVMGSKREGLQQHVVAKYFREKDLMVGTQLVLPQFLSQPTKANTELKPSFLPASIAIYLPPFDTHHLNDLLLLFHIPFDTHMAQKMADTLKVCEGQSQGMGDNFITSLCATSFEAMLKFASSMVRAPNNKLQAVTNSKVVGSVGGKVTILQTAELAAAGRDAVDCHELMFPFKVMGCHRIKESKVMVVRMAHEEAVEADMDLLVACHKNTTLFDPQHEAFAELQSSPGHTEICHFLPNTDIIWIPL